jgi:phosphoglycolate phosphatase
VFIFDFDGTVCDSFVAFLGILDELSRRHGFRAASLDELEAFRSLPIREIIRRMGIPAHRVPLLVREARKAMSAKMPELAPCPGLEPVLEELGRRGAQRWVLTSNSTANVRTFVDRTGLGIDRIYGGAGLLGKGLKLRRALLGLGRGERAIYIGDELRDIDAARAAGLPCGVVGWGYNALAPMLAQRPDYAFQDPGEILALA